MKGIIVKQSQTMPCATIRGDDGIEYFLHRNNYDRGNKFNIGDRVEFEAHDDGKKRLSAVNARFRGCGDRHPFCSIMNGIEKYIVENTKDDFIRQCRIRDLHMLREYFRNQEYGVEELRKIADMVTVYKHQHPVITKEQKDGKQNV